MLSTVLCTASSQFISGGVSHRLRCNETTVQLVCNSHLSNTYGHQVCYVLLQIESMLDMMTLTSGLTTNRRVSSGQASSCHSEPKDWGPLRLYLFTLCIALCTTAHSDSHCSSCRSLFNTYGHQFHSSAAACASSCAPSNGDTVLQCLRG
jgi:hypothetical protein